MNRTDAIETPQRWREMTRVREQKSISFITLGCAKNEVDSERMQALLRNAGFTISDDVEYSDAVVINCCSFITEATEEAIATILEVAGLSHYAKGSGRIIVAGCLPSRYGDELASEFPEVAAFVACDREDDIVEILCQALGLFGGEAPRAGQDDFIGLFGGETPRAGQAGFLRTTTAPWAYVKIADGCDRFCSYCTIPLIKGRYMSRSAEEILAEVAGLVEGGVREIILIAQDTGIWGHDLMPGSGTPAMPGGEVPAMPGSGTPAIRDLADLLENLAASFPHTWFRVMYLQPEGIGERLLDVMAAFDNICNYLDIPLQHANARVLREMNRNGSGEEYLRLLERIREKLPDVALRTTLIAGFPGESRQEAAELEHFIEQAAFDYVGIFAYSREDGTAAGERRDQVPLRTRKARMQRLRDLADAIGFKKTAERLGFTEQVLVIGYDEDASDDPFPLLGRTKRQAPEVDGMIHLDKGSIGELLSATIVQAYCYEMDGKALDKHDE